MQVKKEADRSGNHQMPADGKKEGEKGKSENGHLKKQWTEVRNYQYQRAENRNLNWKISKTGRHKNVTYNVAIRSG